MEQCPSHLQYPTRSCSTSTRACSTRGPQSPQARYSICAGGKWRGYFPASCSSKRSTAQPVFSAALNTLEYTPTCSWYPNRSPVSFARDGISSESVIDCNSCNHGRWALNRFWRWIKFPNAWCQSSAGYQTTSPRVTRPRPWVVVSSTRCWKPLECHECPSATPYPTTTC